MQSTEIQWKAPEFEYHHKNIAWYGAVVIVAALLTAFALLWQKNFFFAVFIIIGAAVMMSWAERKPRILEFRIDNKGIYIDEMKFYPYGAIAGYAISTNDEKWPQLVFRFKSRLGSYLKIPINQEDIEKIKAYLIRFIPEIEYEESLTDAIGKLLKF